MREWNADSYHQVSTPQFDWGLVVLDRLSLEGHELVFDIGCGTGRLTEKVLERLPRGRVVGIDMSSNMLQVARDFLRPRFDRQIQFVMADAAALHHSERNTIGKTDFLIGEFLEPLDRPQLFILNRPEYRQPFGSVYGASSFGGERIPHPPS
jgi:SAM-dependent methyltransferase